MLTEALWNSVQARADFIIWNTVTSGGVGWGLTGQESALQKITWESCWLTRQLLSINVPLQQGRGSPCKAVLAGLWPAGQVYWSFPSVQHFWDHIWRTISNFGPAIPGKRLLHQSPVKGHQDGWRLEHMAYEEWLRAGLVHRAEEKAQGHLAALHC